MLNLVLSETTICILVLLKSNLDFTNVIPDSSVQPKDDKNTDFAEKFAPSEVTANGKKDKIRGPRKKPGPSLGTRRSSKQRELSDDAKNSSEAKNNRPVRRTQKKEPKSAVVKVRKNAAKNCGFFYC